jgi:hypothetical protein
MVHLRSIKPKKYSIYRMAWDDSRGKGYVNNPLLLEYNDHEIILGLGTGDTEYLYKIVGTDETLILSLNLRLYYAGLEVYNGDMVKVSDVFMQNDYDLDKLGDLYELSPITIAKRLYEYCDY